MATTARASSPPCRTASPTCRRTGSPASSSSPTAWCTTFRLPWKASASGRRCTPSSPAGRTSATGRSSFWKRPASASSAGPDDPRADHGARRHGLGPRHRAPGRAGFSPVSRCGPTRPSPSTCASSMAAPTWSSSKWKACPNELTPANNRAVVPIEGIREKLRVLLVSGEPHAGERTWRNLLKSDANVDLVHFTILRPPEKQDGTPINELSLIAFPTRELFQQKIKEFDLIIFDRYANQSVLPSSYFENIVRYVREGGAVLVAAGPEFAELWQPRADAARADHSGPAERPHRRGALQGRASPTRATAIRSPATCRARRQSAARLGRVAAHRRLAGAVGLDPHVGRERSAAPRAAPRGQGARRAASLRSRLALGARVPGRRTASRPPAPPRPLAHEGAGSRRGSPSRQRSTAATSASSGRP